MDSVELSAFQREFEQEIAKDDDSAARRRLASGQPIHIEREDTPPGHVVRIHPDGREELTSIDLEAMAALLGRQESKVRPQLWVVAGPNGAGKTTLMSDRIARRIPVINPDVIAQELPLANGRLGERLAGAFAIERRDRYLAAGRSFAIETTLSGNSSLRFMSGLRRQLLLALEDDRARFTARGLPAWFTSALPGTG